MSFISPLNLFFAALLGAILLLYMLRLKRRERIVSSNLLWDAATRDLQANAPWQKLRSSLLMWLQLSLLTLLVLALARPAIRVFSSGGQTVAIVLDASASMSATDVSPSRFEAARAQAMQLVNALSPRDGATILLAARQTRVLSALSSDKTALKRAISGVKPLDTNSDLREAIVLAASLLRDKTNPQIYVLSDGAAPKTGELELGKVGLQFVKIGRSGENLALTALDVRRPYAKNGAAQLFATVSNYGAREKTVDLELSRDDSLLEVRPVTIPPARRDANGETVPGQASQLFEDLKFESGLFSAKFEVDGDFLEADNVAYARLDAPRDLEICLAADNLFLEKALNLGANTRVFVGDPPASRAFDVVVLDGRVPPNLPKTNQLVFNAQTPLCPIQKLGEVSNPSVTDYDRTHPVARFAPWNDIRFARGWAVKTLAWGKNVVNGERSPLVVAGEKEGVRVVWCGFDLRESDLPLRVAFPIFINNALSWLSAPRGQNSAESAPLRVGTPVPISAPQRVQNLEIVAPDGAKFSLRKREDAPLFFDRAEKVGVYQTKSSDWSGNFAVSLLSKTESDIAPRARLQIGEKLGVAGENRARSNRELWGYLVLLAVALLGLEWWIFHRGT